MQLIPQPPKRTLNKAFLKQRPLRSDMDLFKKELITLLGCIDANETEEFHKNLVSDFLKRAIYHNDHFINTKGRQDLVIHNGKDNKSNVGVIIEAKRPANKTDWFSAENPNGKALHELVLYYLRERIECNNIDIKYLIATNINEWYIIEAQYFENIFYGNKELVKNYEEWRDGKKVTRDTNLFYNEIARPFIVQLENEIPCTYFNLQNYAKALKNEDKEDDKNLIALLKILSPQHLLKVPFANDSNELDDKFYKELLHIIGLEEAKEGSKSIIRRKLENKDSASLLEMAIKKLRTKGIHKITDIKAFGETADEQYFNIGLELCITWINRILFLKLLEGQLISYHKSPSPHVERGRGEVFLNSKMVVDFDELFTLFHNVLAVDIKSRSGFLQHKFNGVPYLNSSLFEISELEDVTICIDSLDNSETLPYNNSTILKEHKKKNESLTTLDYLFQFLDAYDFASEGAEDIQEDNKPLINASVLGKVFEKINGYKDGSIYTPGFITMYMCRQSIRMAVVQKFKDVKGWNVEKFEELYNKIDNIDEANNIINDLKICDPAVGSGHFLVSALNEIIAIKSELKILKDKNGKRLKEYSVEVENDELYITDEDGDIFNYIPANKERQRIQETLFKEKQTIIENCLFGVDINPNSVKICRLRLWIELLKNAFYKEESGYKELETLPNIDINIKCGNSLISRFALDSDLKPALKKSKFTIQAYKIAVQTYRQAENKEQKREMRQLIAAIKNDFISELSFRDKVAKKYVNEKANIVTISSEINRMKLWQEKIPKKLLDDLEKASANLGKYEKEINDIHQNVIYKNALEWRFEFPEVLNDEGDFEGFDVVIGNPPYVSIKEISTPQKEFFLKNFFVATGQFDLYILFIELSQNLLHNRGISSMITSNTFLSNKDFKKLRFFILEKTEITEIINLDESIFSEASLDASILSLIKVKPDNADYNIKIIDGRESFEKRNYKIISSGVFKSFENLEFKVSLNPFDIILFEKFKTNSILLSDISNLNRGIEFGSNSIEIKQNPFEKSLPILVGGDITKYFIKKNSGYSLWKNEKSLYKDFNLYTDKRILIQRIRNLSLKHRIIATYTDEAILCTNTLRVLTLKIEDFDLKYLLSLLNSTLINYFFRLNFLNKDIYAYQLGQIPIKNISSSAQQPFISLVDQILEAKQQGNDSTHFEKQMDELVYELYGITEEERNVIEGIETVILKK